MASDDNDKPSQAPSSGTSAEQKKRIRRKKSNAAGGPSIPTAIVITPGEAMSQPGAVELGLVLSVLVIALYLFGFYEAWMSLPDVPRQRLPSVWRAHMGENLNIPNMDESWSVAGTATASDIGEQGEEGMADAAAEAAVDGGAAQEAPKPVKKGLLQRAFGGGKDKGANAGEVGIPVGVWPVSIRNEDTNFETLIHPGDGKTEMSVPKFWSPPVHGNTLMTRETAMRIGTCNVPDPVSGSYVRGDRCPAEHRTIFIAIASYRDFQCRLTVESAFGRAKYPDRLRIGVVDQIVDGEDAVCNQPLLPCDKDPEQALCKYKDRVDVYEMEAQLSIGPVFARHIGHRMYRGEYYATQSDAHVSFTQDWDVDIITQMEVTNDEMAVLSTYLTDVQGSIDKVTGKSLRHTRPIMCNTYYEGGAQGLHLRHGSQPERDPSVRNSPQLQPWWAAGYSFSRGHFVVNVPYDPYQPMIFQGEEMSIGIRGFTIGYDFYAPERSVCFHHYAVGKNAQIRNKVHHFWENDRKYSGTGKKAMTRLLGIVRMNPEVDVDSWDHKEEDRYGLGGVRTPEKFYSLFGIDVMKKTIEAHLCQFVDRGDKMGMHYMFTEHLRQDGMGIDYNDISFQFRDPSKGERGPY